MSLNKTSIEWVKNPDGTQGYTWNPITGCLNGCEYCYARKLANGRLKSRYLANVEMGDITGQYLETCKLLPHQDPFYPRFWEDRLYHAWGGEPKGIFVCDMSDLFGIGIPEEWTEKVLNLCRFHEQNRYYLLTKQPYNLIKFSPFPENCWVGVSATDEAMFNEALWQLSKIQARIKYISIEPFLKHIPMYVGGITNCGINQIIIGSQTKPYKPPKWEWVSEIIEACVKANIPYFLKNNLEPIVPKVFGGDGALIQELPNA